MKVLHIATEFSKLPFGRYYADGPNSGERFREEILKVHLAELAPGEKLKIVLDEGVESYGSSFLTEGFAGIVKFGYMESNELINRIELSFTDPDFEFYSRKIKQYINETEFNSVVYHPVVQ